MVLYSFGDVVVVQGVGLRAEVLKPRPTKLAAGQQPLGWTNRESTSAIGSLDTASIQARQSIIAAMAVLFSVFVLVRERLELDAGLKVIILVGIMITVDLAWLYLGEALTPGHRSTGGDNRIRIR